MKAAAGDLLSRVLGELGVSTPRASTPTLPLVPLPSRLATGELAAASVGTAAIVAGLDVGALDGSRIAAAYRSDRLLSIDGLAPTVWSAYSGFWRTADGWIRTHGNYPHHAKGLRAALDLTDDAETEDVARAVTALPTETAVSEIVRAGGLAVSVTRENDGEDEVLRSRPLLDIRRGDDAAPDLSRHVFPAASDEAPLRGIRVLDLTRVIAGPVATRTLALLGADVLRIDPPMLPEPEWQHLDTGHGKRSAVLDARSPRMSELIDAADVVVLGYRPGALARLGLSPAALLERNPRLIVAQLSAWGDDAPERAGFDSLVQAASGIAWIESPDGDRPGALPAQALDHSAGYLLAAAVTALVRRDGDEGRGSIVRTSLRRVAAELLSMPRTDAWEPAPDDADATGADHTARFVVDGRVLTTARPALPGLEFTAPHRWGVDQPRW